MPGEATRAAAGSLSAGKAAVRPGIATWLGRQIQKARRVRSDEPVVADPTPITSVAGTFCPNAGEYQPSAGSVAPRINDQPNDDGRVIVAVASPPWRACHRRVRTQPSKLPSTVGPR